MREEDYSVWGVIEEIKEEEVNGIVTHLGNNKAPGPDGI